MRLSALVLLAVSLLAALPTAAQRIDREPIPRREPGKVELPPAPEVIRRPFDHDSRAMGLAARYRTWLEEVDILLAREERETFFELGEDYQRDAFIREFWRSRDPDPRTARNEFREQYRQRVAAARGAFSSLADQRARALLYLGEPVERYEITCGALLWPAEAWFYFGSAHERAQGEFALVFYRKWGAGHWRLWEPGDGYDTLRRDDSAGGSLVNCHYEELLAALALIGREGLSYLVLLAEVEEPPPPATAEWVPTFKAYATDLAPGVETFAASLEWSFPGWSGQRAVAQATVRVPVEESAATGHHYLINGEVLRSGDGGELELFERFRYRFDLDAPPAPGAGATLPLVFQRYLRPGGPYTLVVRVEDLATSRFFRSEQRVRVPAIEMIRATAPSLPAAPAPPAGPLASTSGSLAAANATIAAGEVSLEILETPGELKTGYVRFEAALAGEERVDRVVFSLDGAPVLTKAAPPFSVELDLGELPRVRLLRATALDAAGRELASDETLLNAGGYRFAVRITDPAPGAGPFETGSPASAVRVRAQVEVPRGERLERLEIFVGEECVATLYQPPWVQTVTLPSAPGSAGLDPTYLRAVATLSDGAGSTEDLVWLDAPEGFAAAVEVRLVELYTRVTDRAGRPVAGLSREDFTVREDGVVQEVQRFQVVRDLPFTAAVLLDTSASMKERLDPAREAAFTFFRRALAVGAGGARAKPGEASAAAEPGGGDGPLGRRDRVGLITFNDRPHEAVPFTRDAVAFGRGLAGLAAERGTALWDSLVQSLFLFNGIQGQKALLVLSDGDDERSRYRFEDALEYARRSGVTLYALGLDLPRRGNARRQLERLAEETGGRAFFLADASELADTYSAILEELRSRYLLTYAAPEGDDDSFRSVEVDVARRGLTATTLRGYYP